MRTIVMLLMCLAVAGAMAGILRFFLRKLARIEEDMWGEKARQVREARKKAHAP